MLHPKTSNRKTHVDHNIYGKISHTKLVGSERKALLFLHRKLIFYRAPAKMAAVWLQLRDIIPTLAFFFFFTLHD